MSAASANEDSIRRKAAGRRVLSANASELERDFAFGVVRQLFERSLDRKVRSRVLDGAAAPA
jgi:hypothetical protein